MKVLSYLLVFLFILQISSGIRINEIMYNPAGTDNNNEFIEIFSYPQTDLSNYIISDGDSNDTLMLFHFIIDSNYSLIVEDDYLIKTNNASIYKIGATIGNGLSSDDTIYFYNSDTNLKDSVEINSSIANGNGYSMSYQNGSWVESQQINGTPGYENSIDQGINQTPPEETENKGLELVVYLDDVTYVGITYTSLFKIKNLDHITGITDHINLTIEYNITLHNKLFKQDTVFLENLNSFKTSNTGSFTPIAAGNYTITGWVINSTVNDSNPNDDINSKIITVIDTTNIPCNITLKITTDKEIYTETESVKFHNNLNNKTFPFIIEYWIEDFFGNIYKNKFNTTNTNQKSWKTNIAEQDRVLFIKSIAYPTCNDSNLSDNSAEKMFIVKSESGDSSGTEKSSLEITDVDDEVRFGEVIDVKVRIYKGDTTKYSVSLWVEDGGDKISETTKIHLYDKFSSYNGQIPIKLDSNCDSQLEDGEYDVVIKGLDEEDRKEIKIEGIKTSSCPQPSSSPTSYKKSSSKKFDFELTEFNEIVKVGNSFNTKLMFTNNNNEDIDIKVWSYVYRGSKSYSNDREENKKEFILPANSLQIVELSNIVEDADPGDYKFKVVVNKNNQKTNNEITKDITINNNLNKNNLKNTQNGIDFYDNMNDKITNNAISDYVYESTTEKAKNLIPIFLIFLLVLFNIVLIWKR